MSNGMRSCAQGARGVVIALQPVMAFCHKNLGLLNKRVSTQPGSKTQGMGQKARLTLAALLTTILCCGSTTAMAVTCWGGSNADGTVIEGCNPVSRRPFVGFVINGSQGFSEWFSGGDVAAAFAANMSNLNAYYQSQPNCLRDLSISSQIPVGSAPITDTGGPWRRVFATQEAVMGGAGPCYGAWPGTYHSQIGISGICGEGNHTGLITGVDDACYCRVGMPWSFEVNACVPPPNCLTGQRPNRVTGACEYSPKNNDDCGVGNPVKASTGNKRQRENDLQSAAVFQFSRVYNSNPPLFNENIGAAWTHSYARSVNSQPSGAWREARRQDGKAYDFSPVAGGWTTDADIPDRLTELKDASGVRTGWRYTVAADDSIETYSAAGKLLSIADRTGRTQTLTYDLPAASGGDDDPNTLDTVTDDTGRQLRFTYDTNNRIATVTDPAGGLITYGYDAQSNLVSVTYPDGRSKTYHYNEPEHTAGANLPRALTGITDENGDRYATYQYSADGKAIATGHAGGADLYTLTYGTNSTTVTDPLGTQRTHNFTTILGVVKSTGQSQPGGSGCGPASSATTYDANGNVASRADFNGNKTCYAYDLARNLETARVEGLASGTACPTTLATYTPAPNTAQRKILTEWHATFRLPVKVTEAGRETSTVYDTRGNITSHSIKDTVLNQTRTWTTSYTYHATVPGVLVQKIDNGPRTDVADLTTPDYYLPDENCLGGHYGCRGQVRQVTNALGHVTTYNEYDPHGRVLRTTDPNGLVTTMAYTPRGWLTRRDVGGEITRFDYDNVGQLIKLTRPDGSHVGFEYDAAHRLTAIVQQDGARLTYTLDPAGNRIQEDITGADGSYVYYTHRRTFDALGRLWQDIGAYNQTVTYEYDAQGNLKQIDGARTDVADLTRHTYDNLDRLTQTLNADSGIEQTTVNALDQTTRVVDPANQATQHTVNVILP